MINHTKKTTVFLLILAVLFSACKKETPATIVKNERTVRFVLYTEKDFSNENGNITFSIFIREDNRNNMFDSAFTTMKVKDIPSRANKIVIEKKVVVDPQVKLTAGFVYTLENYGYSWYLETGNPGELFREINYSFK